MPVTPKYRLLTKEELESLEKEFVNYLIVNGITADDWVKLKAEEKDKAEDIVALFSDVVFEGIMRKVLFLDYFQKNEIRTFQCLQDKLILVGMKSNDPSHDFTDQDFIREAMLKAPEGLEVYTTEKAYKESREIELFKMTLSGCEISDGRLFKALSLSLAS